jgi:plastocyanin
MRKLLITLLIGAVAASGCAGDDAAPDGDSSLDITAVDNSFEPASAQAAAGTVTVTVTNEGELPHTFTITELGVNESLDPGDTAEVTFDVDAGSYEYVCTLHPPNMVGTLTVS